MKIHCRIVRLGVLLFVLLFTVGCGSRARMGKYTYRVTLDSALRDSNTNMMPSIEVDFVGVNESESDRWLGQNIDDYFTPGNLQRVNADRHTMEFTNDRSSAQTLSAGSGTWNSWQGAGAKNMIILASIPLASSQFAVDPRRLVLPLDQARWGREGMTIELLIKPSGIVLMTAMRPVKE